MSVLERAPEQFQPAINWALQFNDLTIRERAVISVAALCVTWALWFYFVDDYFAKARAQAARSAQMTAAEIEMQEDQKKKLMKLIALDPNDPVRSELSAVKADLSSMERTLQSSLSQFIPPAAMTMVLRDVMTDHDNLTLTLLNRLPARELLPEEEHVHLYLHPMQIELEGTYLEVLNYVQSLESGEWQFNWRSFDFKTKGYPNGVATIEIETLSRDKHWLGL